ncbi:MAG: glycosyltransferase family 2 protein, partial [Devosia sp.]
MRPNVTSPTVSVVIPCYRVRAHILGVIANIGPEVVRIYVVDDACPEETGKFVQEVVSDPRVQVIFNDSNLGVGGATMAGLSRACEEGADIVVKIDGDGQMDAARIPEFVGILASGDADYAKGNRFFDLEGLATMPFVRLVGNAVLSFLTKLSTGYWHIMDPTNGYFAIRASIVPLLPAGKIAQRYFFESDLLFRLNLLGARVVDIPMPSRYNGEASSLQPYRELPIFAISHLRNLC